MINAEIMSRMLAGLALVINMSPFIKRKIPRIRISFCGSSPRMVNVQKQTAVKMSKTPNILINIGFLKQVLF